MIRDILHRSFQLISQLRAARVSSPHVHLRLGRVVHTANCSPDGFSVRLGAKTREPLPMRHSGGCTRGALLIGMVVEDHDP